MVIMAKYRIHLYAYCHRCAVNQKWIIEDKPAIVEKEVMSNGKEPKAGFTKDEVEKPVEFVVEKKDELKNVVKETVEVKKNGKEDKGKATA